VIQHCKFFNTDLTGEWLTAGTNNSWEFEKPNKCRQIGYGICLFVLFQETHY